jgi:hypothetical protein
MNYLAGSLSNVAMQYYVNSSKLSSPPAISDWRNIVNGGELFTIRVIQKEFSAWVKDDWKVKPNLTLTPGLRWDYTGVPYLDDGTTTGLVGRRSGFRSFGPRLQRVVESRGTWSGNVYSIRRPGFVQLGSGRLSCHLFELRTCVRICVVTKDVGRRKDDDSWWLSNHLFNRFTAAGNGPFFFLFGRSERRSGPYHCPRGINPVQRVLSGFDKQQFTESEQSEHGCSGACTECASRVDRTIHADRTA